MSGLPSLRIAHAKMLAHLDSLGPFDTIKASLALLAENLQFRVAVAKRARSALVQVLANGTTSPEIIRRAGRRPNILRKKFDAAIHTVDAPEIDWESLPDEGKEVYVEQLRNGKWAVLIATCRETPTKDVDALVYRRLGEES